MLGDNDIFFNMCLQICHFTNCVPARTSAMQVHTYHLVINSEVVIELDNAFRFCLELSVGLLCPPLFEVAMAVVLAP